MKLNLKSFTGIIIILIVGYLSILLVKESKIRQEIVIENAEVKNIKYGLLSVYSWKRQISNILAKKVKEFELTTETRIELRKSIQEAMIQILNEVEKILEEKRNEGWWIKRVVSSVIQSFVFDINDLKRKVPELTEIILDELDKYETREKLRVYIQKKIDDVLYEKFGEEDLAAIVKIGSKYECDGISDCSTTLQIKLNEKNNLLWTLSGIILILIVLTFILIIVFNDNIQIIEISILIILVGILLIVGITTPMIDIDARITDFSFALMGEQIKFSDQILFFQSKSIFDVVSILISTGEFQSILVGILIFLFSIIFPILKLISSFGLILKKSLYNNKFIHFFALKSGKWSMADVIVVAIFMSYIGFKGIIGNQLQQLESISGKVEVLTTDNSSFQVGFLLFLTFCLGGLILATVIEKKLVNNKF